MAQRHTPDRKVRVKGNRVIHTTRGSVYKGVAEEPLEDRQAREAARRAVEAKPRRVGPRTTDEVASTRKR